MMGKYLNEYQATYPAPRVLGEWTPPWVTYVPPGWNGWDVVGNGYIQYNYLLNHNHHVIKHGTLGTDYLNSVLQHYGTQFITDTAAQQRPFFLEIASFSPHTPSTPAPADVGTFAGITVPQGPAFDRLPTDPPSWLAGHTPLSTLEIDRLSQAFQKRVESVQSVDRMIGTLEQTLRRPATQEHHVRVQLRQRLPHGPARPASRKAHRVRERCQGSPHRRRSGHRRREHERRHRPERRSRSDLEQLAGATPPPSVEGRSLVPLLAGEHPPWRSLALIEHVARLVQAVTPTSRATARATRPPIRRCDPRGSPTCAT